MREFNRAADAVQQIGAGHLITDFDRAREADGVGAAMALDDDPLQAEKHAAINGARVHTPTQFLKGAARQQIAEFGEERAVHRLPEIGGDLLGCAFGRFQGDVAGEAFGDDNVNVATADAVALDKAGVGQARQVGFSQDLRSFLDLLDALDLFRTDIEQAAGRSLAAQTVIAARHRDGGSG